MSSTLVSKGVGCRTKFELLIDSFSKRENITLPKELVELILNFFLSYSFKLDKEHTTADVKIINNFVIKSDKNHGEPSFIVFKKPISSGGRTRINVIFRDTSRYGCSKLIYAVCIYIKN